jgi:hypothetical protein
MLEFYALQMSPKHVFSNVMGLSRMMPAGVHHLVALMLSAFEHKHNQPASFMPQAVKLAAAASAKLLSIQPCMAASAVPSQLQPAHTPPAFVHVLPLPGGGTLPSLHELSQGPRS